MTDTTNPDDLPPRSVELSYGAMWGGDERVYQLSSGTDQATPDDLPPRSVEMDRF